MLLSEQNCLFKKELVNFANFHYRLSNANKYAIIIKIMSKFGISNIETIFKKIRSDIMQYVVQVSGEVLDKQNKAYVVDSKTAEEAQLIATQTFCEDFGNDFRLTIHNLFLCWYNDVFIGRTCIC